MKTLEASYAPEHDITFILEMDDNCSFEIVGFYFGEPNEECTKEYAHKGLKFESAFGKED